MKHANKILGLVTAAMLVVLYVIGYFGFGTKHDTYDSATGQPVVVRSFPSEWQALLYVPAAMCEDLMLGNGAFSSPE